MKYNKSKVLFSKEKILFVFGLVMMVFSSCISVFAASFLYNSNEVSFNNSSSPSISSNNVQGAIDELYSAASDYSALQSRVAALEGRWGAGTSNVNSSWLRITNSGSAQRGVALYDGSGTYKSGLYYDPDGDKTTLDARGTSGNYGQGKLDLRGNPVMVNGTSIGDYYKVTNTTFSTTTKAQLNAHSGSGFSTLLTSLPSVTAPSGYTLVSHIHVEITGQPGLIGIFDDLSNATKTSSIGGYAYNSSASNITSGKSVQIRFLSLWKKS